MGLQWIWFNLFSVHMAMAVLPVVLGCLWSLKAMVMYQLSRAWMCLVGSVLHLEHHWDGLLSTDLPPTASQSPSSPSHRYQFFCPKALTSLGIVLPKSPCWHLQPVIAANRSSLWHADQSNCICDWNHTFGCLRYKPEREWRRAAREAHPCQLRIHAPKTAEGMTCSL